ncbi:NAD kinase [Oceanobacillus chungangensis]|uniref:NAD kinase n=1 Tax=Oceanobacillus chungangensis TaxID=1229152 RepID=A0A3D8Q1R6_9BACI|nr:NAD kinase [Oceanobacillus chungangensis]RDW21548.1 NAD kinase [Oceanobacillus chungangensis]
MTDRNKMFFYFHNDNETTENLKPLFSLAKEHGFELVENSKHANIIVSIGGDGMFLQAVRKTGFRQDAIYAGITGKDESSLYCDFNLDRFDDLLDSVLRDELEVRRFPIITAQINDGTKFYCLNEVSVQSTIVKTIVIDVFIDDQLFETFRGDGLVVSTPTGSTGYSKSANGAVVDPLIPSIQVSEVASMNNNNYRTLGSSFILNKDRKLRLKLRQEGNVHPIISLDNEAHSIQRIENVVVTMDDKVIKTVKLKNNSFWDRVRRSFL